MVKLKCIEQLYQRQDMEADFKWSKTEDLLLFRELHVVDYLMLQYKASNTHRSVSVSSKN